MGWAWIKNYLSIINEAGAGRHSYLRANINGEKTPPFNLQATYKYFSPPACEEPTLQPNKY
jgi:hypothetical protein